MSYPLPIIRLTLEHMQQEIVHAFAAREGEYKEAIEKGIDDAVKNFNFHVEIERLVCLELQKTCADVVHNVAIQIAWNPLLQKQAKRALLKALKSK